MDDIIAELDQVYNGKLPEGAIRAAQQRREEITPRLIDLVRKATDAVRSGGRAPPGNGHLFALYLLTEFSARSALPAILEAVSLPADGPFELFGDAITEDLCRVLSALADAPDVLDGLIANRSLNEYVRWEAAQTYLLFVRDGRLTRDQAVERLRGHLRDAIENRDAEVASGLVAELESYAPHEAIEEIAAAFRFGLVDESIVGMKDIKRSIAQGEAQLQRSLTSCRPTGISDTVEELSQWHSFQKRGADSDEDAPDDDDPTDEPHEFGDLDGDFDEMADVAGPPIREDGPGDFRISEPETPATTIRHAVPRVGRNDPCPCGSGKKYKKCCGAR
jgi:hypothetical protein